MRQGIVDHMQSLKKFDLRLYTTLMAIAVLPTIYNTIRIHYLGNLPSDSGINITSQLIWVNIIYEVMKEALILPLFHLIGKSLSNKSDLENKVKTGLIISATIYFLISVTIFTLAKPMLNFMAQKPVLIEASVIYIRLESVAIFLSVAYQFIAIVFISLRKHKPLVYLLCCQLVTTIISDSLLISGFSFSLNLGVNGIAIGNILVNFLLIVISILLLQKQSIFLFSKKKPDFSWSKEWFKIGGLAGLESLIRNTVFTIFILKLINEVEGQGFFWLSNSFIWEWLLIPILVLGEVIKRNTGVDPNGIKERIGSYFIITSIIVILWMAAMPFWSVFMHKAMNIKEYETVFHLTTISIAFYICFAYNNILDSIFYGLGRTDIMLVQSVIINILYYGGLSVVYYTGLIVPTLELIIIMFGIGIVLDSIVTFLMFRLYTRNSTLLENFKFSKV